MVHPPRNRGGDGHHGGHPFGASSPLPSEHAYMSSSSPSLSQSSLLTDHHTLLPLLCLHHSLRRRCYQDPSLLTQNNPIVLMAPRRHAPVDSRLQDTSVQDLHRRVERRRPKPKSKRPPGYYQNLIERHDNLKATIRHRYADATKDNLSGIKSKFIR
jgi:hypothetical protein